VARHVQVGLGLLRPVTPVARRGEQPLDVLVITDRLVVGARRSRQRENNGNDCGHDCGPAHTYLGTHLHWLTVIGNVWLYSTTVSLPTFASARRATIFVPVCETLSTWKPNVPN